MPASFASLARLPLGGVPFAQPAANADEEPLKNVGRRGAPRLRLSIPARLVTVTEMRRCVVLDISRSGAQVSLAKPLAVGEGGFLHFAGSEVFVSVIREGKGLIGVEFDVLLTDEDVLAIRRYAEDYETDERKALLNEARAWVMGAS